MPEGRALYTLGVKLKVTPDGLQTLLTRLREVSTAGYRVQQTIQGINTALERVGQTAPKHLDKIRDQLQYVKTDTHDVVTGAKAITVGYREAASAASSLRQEIQRMPTRAPRMPSFSPGRNPGSNRPGGGGESGMGDRAGDFFGLFVGGGMGAMLGSGLGSMLAGGPGGLMGGIAGTAADSTLGGIQSLIASTAALGSRAESTKASLSGLFMSVNGIDADKANALGAMTYRQLRQDAARGVGSIDDYTRAYTELYTPLAQSGASMDQIRRLTKLSIGQGAVMRGRLGMELAPLDIVQALTSGLSERQTPFAMAALRASGSTRQQFDAADVLGKVAILVKGFEAFGPAVEKIGQTFEAQADTLADSGTRFVQELTGPIFDGLKYGFMSINDLFSDPSSTAMFSQNLSFLTGAIGVAASRILEWAGRFGKGFTDNGAAWQQTGRSMYAASYATGGLLPTNAEELGSDTSQILSDVLGYGARSVATTGLLAKFAAKHFVYGGFSDYGVGDLGRDLFGYGTAKVPGGFGVWQKAPLWQGPPSQDADSTQSDVKKLIDDLNALIAKDRTVTIKVDPIRLDWGDDRNAAINLERLVTSVAEQAVNSRSIAASGIFALSGAS